MTVARNGRLGRAAAIAGACAALLMATAVQAQARAIGAARVGTVQRILVEGPARRQPGDAPELMGRTECNRIVNFPAGPQAARLVGQMIDVRITAALPHSLRGEVALQGEAAAAAG